MKALLLPEKQGNSDAEISDQTSVAELKVAEIRALVEDTQHMRTPSQAPEVEF